MDKRREGLVYFITCANVLGRHVLTLNHTGRQRLTLSHRKQRACIYRLRKRVPTGGGASEAASLILQGVRETDRREDEERDILQVARVKPQSRASKLPVHRRPVRHERNQVSVVRRLSLSPHPPVCLSLARPEDQSRRLARSPAHGTLAVYTYGD